MSTQVQIASVSARKLAAVRRLVPIGRIAGACRPALDKVWDFLGQNPGLRTDGHNIFLYHHPDKPHSPMNIDFGVEVTRAFPPSGEVALVETPAGKAATAVHIGPYDQLGRTSRRDPRLGRYQPHEFRWQVLGDLWRSER